MLRQALLSLRNPISRAKYSSRLLSTTRATRSEAEKKKKKEATVWMVQLVEADPDYKRPSVHVDQQFFPTKKSAEAFKKQMIRERMKLIEWRWDGRYKFSQKQLFDGTYDEHIYKESYMGIPAYDLKVTKVKLQDPDKIDEVPSINGSTIYYEESQKRRKEQGQ